MLITSHLDMKADSRQLVRFLRRGIEQEAKELLPESVAWQLYVELNRRGEPRAAGLFISRLKSLHSRRATGAGKLSSIDADSTEHRLSPDPYLADLWRAYKKCITNHRTGPASQLLRDIEEQLLN